MISGVLENNLIITKLFQLLDFGETDLDLLKILYWIKRLKNCIT